MLLIRERYLKKIRPFYDLDIIKVLVGSRRAGKSMVLQMIINELLTKGVEEDQIVYLNFEKEEFVYIDDHKKLDEYVLKRVQNKKMYLFFDEIYHVKNFEKAINSFRVSFPCSIFITGSNSKMLSIEISSLLTGRTIQFPIFPFSYQEAVEYKKMINLEWPNSFYNFLELGGYPLRFNLTERDDILYYINGLYNDICQKDIFSRDSTIEKNKFNRVASYVILNAGNEINAESIYNYLKSSNRGKEVCSLSTIYNYLEKMKNAFLLTEIKRYDVKGKDVLKSNPKFYAIDNGMRIIQASSNVFDRGKFLENVICLELLSRGYEVYVGNLYKTEIDFVVIKNGKKCFIQVSYIMENKETLDREFNVLKKIRDASPKYVLSLDKFDFSQDGITHLNIEDFLLGKVDLYLS